MNPEMNEPMIDEEEEYVLYLTDEEGVEHKMELLDMLQYEKGEYCIMRDITTEEQLDEVIVVETYKDEEGNDCFKSVDDDEIADKVFDIFVMENEG